MKLLGLTGGVGMGKSTAAQFLVKRGVSLVDTDILAREVVGPGQPALKEIQRTFGDEVIASDGQLRRDVLARIVFSDPVARQKLESLTADYAVDAQYFLATMAAEGEDYQAALGHYKKLADAGEQSPEFSRTQLCGFYWTEGLRGLGWAVDAVPTLKGGSTIGIPSPPALWDPRDGSIFALFVHPNYERRGIGRALWPLACEILRASGHAAAMLTTEPSTRAERFY